MISESERKRLQSLKEKKQAFKARKEFVHRALSNLDNSTNNNKIIFDDDFDKEQYPKRKGKRDLFNDDNDNEDSLEASFNIDKINHRQVKLGNDARFTLDDRFEEDSHEANKTEITEGIDQYDLRKEKERDLDILEGVLGTPFKIKSQEIKSTTKKRSMIRYDPTENEHGEYEVEPTKIETKEKKIKRKKCKESVSVVEESAPVEVSKDFYYFVSDNLAKSFGGKEGFSLLEAYGRKAEEETDLKVSNVSSVENKEEKFKFNFSTENAFKYDSSDNETDEVLEANKETTDKVENENYTRKQLESDKDLFFFESNDVRFNEAIKFFSREATSNEELKNLRRELKIIVRKKIRTNEKKRQPRVKKRK